MNNYWLLFVLLMSLSAAAMADSSMRCGTQLVTVGDSKAEVLLTCGEPLLKETIAIKESSKEIVIKDKDGKKGRAYSGNVQLAISSTSLVSEPVDQWTYALGKGYFLRHLIFQGGVLIDIRTGEKI